MLFTILYIVMSVNRFDTKLWLLLHSLLDCFVHLKEKNMRKYLNLFKGLVNLRSEAYFFTEIC